MYHLYTYSIYSRANAPTGSAGEESVSWCWVVVVVVVVAVVVVVDVVDVVDVVVVVVVVAVARCFVGAHARRARARAPNKPPNPDSFGARARARPHICGKDVREPTN